MMSRVLVVLTLVAGLTLSTGPTAMAVDPGSGDSGYQLFSVPIDRSSIDTFAFVGDEGLYFFSDPAAHVVWAAAGVSVVVVGNGSSGLPVPGDPTGSPLVSPTGIAFDVTNDVLYIADTGANMVLRVDGFLTDRETAQLSIVAGTGVAGSADFGSGPVQATTAKLNAPRNIALGSDGVIFVSDTGNDSVVAIDTIQNTIVPIAGAQAENCDGDTGSIQPLVSAPRGLLVDPTSGDVIIADTGHHRVMNWTPETGGVPCRFTTIAGTGISGTATAGPATESALAAPVGVDRYPEGLLISDSGNHQLYLISDEELSVVAGNGSADPIDFTSLEDPLGPTGVSMGAISQALFLGGPGVMVLIDSTNNVFAVLLPAEAPNEPTDLVATAGDGSASVSFTAPNGNGGRPITKYQYKVGNGAWTDAVGTTSPITITGLPNYQISRIRLRAVNSIGDGFSSDPVQVWPRIAGSSLTSVRATNRTSIRAAFAALTPVGGRVSHYWVYAYAKGTNTVVGSCRSSASARSCTVTGLTAGTEYDVAVRGFFTLTGSPTVLPTLDSNSIRVRTKS